MVNKYDPPATLYKHFAKDGTFLYVGVTTNLVARTSSHKRDSRWFKEVATIETEEFALRSDALAMETHIIKTEQPKYNQHGNPDWYKNRRTILIDRLVPNIGSPMTHNQVRELLRLEVAALPGGKRAFCLKYGWSRSGLSALLNGDNPISKPVLASLGLCTFYFYREINPSGKRQPEYREISV